MFGQELLQDEGSLLNRNTAVWSYEAYQRIATV